MAEIGSRVDFERLRLRSAGLRVPGSNLIGGGVPAFVGRVTSASSKIAVGDFLLVQPTFVLGQESEGASGAFTPVGSATVPVYLIGPAKPTTGDYLVCKFVDNRWAAERGNAAGGGGPTGPVGSIPFCYCNPPTSLVMTSLDETCNYRMFQSCTIRYQATPAVYSGFFLPAMVYLSDQFFPDPIAGGALFQYYLSCRYNQFLLTRLYPTSPYGSPYQDSLLWSWLLGGYGNTCSPFHLDDGTPFPGSDASCGVLIDAV